MVTLEQRVSPSSTTPSDSGSKACLTLRAGQGMPLCPMAFECPFFLALGCLAQPPFNYVNLDNLIRLSLPQLPHLLNGDKMVPASRVAVGIPSVLTCRGSG